MIKRLLIGTMIGATLMAMASVGVMASEVTKVESNGITFDIPEQYKDLLTIETEGLEPNTLISVSETASIKAAEAMGKNYDGAGWLFSVTKVSKNELGQLRCGGMDGMDVFAKCDEDEDFYLVFNHPTDVRYVREDNEAMKKDQDQWSMLCDWAYDGMEETILLNNPQLEAKTFTNTDLDMYLARAAFQPDTNFEIRSLEFGTLDPKKLSEDDFIEDLTDDVTYAALEEQEDIDGEYVVMAFPDDSVRFEFFPDYPGNENIIREVRTLDGEELVSYYEARFETDDDEVKTAGGIMQAWAEALAR